MMRMRQLIHAKRRTVYEPRTLNTKDELTFEVMKQLKVHVNPLRRLLTIDVKSYSEHDYEIYFGKFDF